MAATDLIDNCTTCAESEDLCGVLDEILFTLEDVDAEAQITPERLRLVNLVQWAALKCSRKIDSTPKCVQGKFLSYGEVEAFLWSITPHCSLTRFCPAKLTTSENASPHRRKGRFVEKRGEGRSESFPRTPASPYHIEDSSSMEEGEICVGEELGRDRFS
ncbi:hypothetical protein TNCV_4474601 [Trichonephila clavipes]|nr:hypothetical protein TNCV_4474601 [Trichonephila clavipes]